MHVDDCIVTGTQDGQLKVENQLRKKFNITVKHNPQIIMGVQVERVRSKRWLKLHQQGFVQSMVDKYGMAQIN